MKRALFAVAAAGLIGMTVIFGLQPLWFVLAKLGVEERVVDFAFWRQSMPVVVIGLIVGAIALAIADRHPRLAVALLLVAPPLAYVAAHVMLALTL